MKKSRKKTGGGRGGFRLEWEESKSGVGTLYLFGVERFGEYADDCKCFQTGVGRIAVKGGRLLVGTFRSGAVEVCGEIGSVTYTPGLTCRKEDGRASD